MRPLCEQYIYSSCSMRTAWCTAGAPGLIAAMAPAAGAAGGPPRGTGGWPPGGAGDVMSWMLDRRLSFFLALFMRMKYFCAWLATCGRELHNWVPTIPSRAVLAIWQGGGVWCANGGAPDAACREWRPLLCFSPAVLPRCNPRAVSSQAAMATPATRLWV